MESLFVLLLALLAFPLCHCIQPYEEDLRALLSPSLNHYDTLHPHTITHTLHGTQSQPHHSRLVEFHTLERHFQLFLKPHHRLFSPGFKVQSMDSGGRLKHHSFHRTEYYHGFMGGEENSTVTAHISKSGIITASISTVTETYHLEPSQDFIKRPHPPHMIAYRSSDVKRRLGVNGSRFDYVVAPPLPPDVQTPTTSDHHEDHQTVKRQSEGNIGGTSCSMIIVADYRFYDQFAAGGNEDENIAGITRRLITILSQVDTRTYRGTEWILNNTAVVTGLGLEIAEVLIHEEPFDDTFIRRPDGYYNSRRCCGDLISGPLDADGLLAAFNFGRWDEFCLAHLFTFVDFDSGLLGLANIAGFFQSQTGGICSESFTDSSRQEPIIYNTGLSSFTSGGTPLIRDEQLLVTAHEVGHNWGSHHDPSDDPQCVNSYLMNEFAQDGSEENHFRFSRCSRILIGHVLGSKASCFTDPGSCGDYVINEGPDGVLEECDEGLVDDRVCCTADCKLKEDAVCSDTNFPCCSNCGVVSTATVCDRAGTLTTDCRTDIYCNGVDPSCPNLNTAGMAPPRTQCLLGLCQTQPDSNLTECVDYCTFDGKEMCSCTQEDDECMLCCKEPDRPCEVSERNVALPTGRRCSSGSCIGGKCRAIQDTLSRILFDIIVNLNIDELVLFMEENIVGFTLIFTLLLWVPAAILLHCCYDRALWKRFKLENVDYIRALLTPDSEPEKAPLIDDRGELGRRSTSPIDNSPHPVYSRGGLHTVPEEEEEESESETDRLEHHVTLV